MSSRRGGSGNELRTGRQEGRVPGGVGLLEGAAPVRPGELLREESAHWRWRSSPLVDLLPGTNTESCARLQLPFCPLITSCHLTQSGLG